MPNSGNHTQSRQRINADLMKPFSKSEWMTPAAYQGRRTAEPPYAPQATATQEAMRHRRPALTCGAVKPARIVHALVSFSPVVKYVRSPSCLYVARIWCMRSGQLQPGATRWNRRVSRPGGLKARGVAIRVQVEARNPPETAAPPLRRQARRGTPWLHPRRAR